MISEVSFASASMVRRLLGRSSIARGSGYAARGTRNRSDRRPRSGPAITPRPRAAGTRPGGGRGDPGYVRAPPGNRPARGGSNSTKQWSNGSSGNDRKCTVRSIVGTACGWSTLEKTGGSQASEIVEHDLVDRLGLGRSDPAAAAGGGRSVGTGLNGRSPSAQRRS